MGTNNCTISVTRSHNGMFLACPSRGRGGPLESEASGLCSWQRENSVDDTLALAGFGLSRTSHKTRSATKGTSTVWSSQCSDLRSSQEVTNDDLKLKWMASCLPKTQKDLKEITLISLLRSGLVSVMNFVTLGRSLYLSFPLSVYKTRRISPSQDCYFNVSQ